MTSPDPPDFDDFYRREWRALTALGWSLVGSWTAAEELAQDALVDAHRRWDMVGRLDKPGAWVRRAVLNRAVSYRRTRLAETKAIGQLSQRAAHDQPAAAGDAGIDDDHAQFWAAVRELPERQAHCLTLHYVEEHPVAAIAEIVGCSKATVKVHLHRGRRALARRLDRRTGEVIELESVRSERASMTDDARKGDAT